MIRKFGKFQCSTVTAILISLLMVVPGLADLAKAEWPTAENQNWTITESEEYQDRELVLEGSVYILSGGLTLTNVNVKIKSSPGHTNGIFVEDGGTLTVSGGSIQAYDPQYPMKMALRGSAILDGTSIQYLWGDNTNPKSGIMVLSDNVQITNCDIGYAGGSAIYLYRSQAVVESNKIHDAHWGVFLDGDTIFTEPNFRISGSDISYSPANPAPTAGSTLTLTVTVHNDGGRDAAALVSIYDGNPKSEGILISESTKVIPGAGSLDFTKDWMATAGSHTFYFVVDRINAVGETDEADNTASLNIDVRFMVMVGAGLEMLNPVAGIPVYAFRGDSYLLSAVTDEMGRAFFSIPNPTGEYVFKTDYTGYRFKSDPIQMPASSSGYITIRTWMVSVAVQTSYQDEPEILNNIPVYLFRPDLSYLNMERTTGQDGPYADFDVPFMPYQYRADYLGISQFSEPYTANYYDECPQVAITFFEGQASITVKQGDTLLDGIPLYIFSADGSYLGLSAVTGSEGVPGQATFRLPEGNYKIRTDFEGNHYWARANGQDIITINRDVETPIEINTDGAVVTVTVDDGAGNGIVNIPVYAFTSGSYTNKFGITNSNGEATIRLSQGEFTFRTDYLGNPFWSSVITVPDTTAMTISILHSNVQVTVYKNDDGTRTALSGVPVYLFAPSGNYLGKYAASDSNGQVSFNLPNGQEYKWRGDYEGYQFWSDAYTIQQGISPYIDIVHNHATITVKTEYNGVETPVSGINVYAFTSTESYIGTYGQTQLDGTVQFLLPNKDYKCRSDYLGQQYWSNLLTLTSDQSDTIHIDEGKASVTVTSGENAVSIHSVISNCV